MSEAVPRQIVLTSRDQVLAFLGARPDPDEMIRWTCPECNAVNDGAYHSHITRCGSCGKGHFPAIPLPIVGDAKTSVKRAFMNDRLFQIDNNISDAKEEIDGHESEIDELERYVRGLEEEREELKKQLYLDLVEAGDA